MKLFPLADTAARVFVAVRALKTGPLPRIAEERRAVRENRRRRYLQGLQEDKLDDQEQEKEHVRKTGNS